MHRILSSLPEPREIFSRTFMHCITTNPRSARWLVAMMALYLHLGPFSKFVVSQIDRKVTEADAGQHVAPPRMHEAATALAN
jgi:hypothetical protein